jgi:hypothetical protein
MINGDARSKQPNDAPPQREPITKVKSARCLRSSEHLFSWYRSPF